MSTIRWKRGDEGNVDSYTLPDGSWYEIHASYCGCVNPQDYKVLCIYGKHSPDTHEHVSGLCGTIGKAKQDAEAHLANRLSKSWPSSQ